MQYINVLLIAAVAVFVKIMLLVGAIASAIGQ